jgi:non-heme chloroperoxidase
MVSRLASVAFGSFLAVASFDAAALDYKTVIGAGGVPLTTVEAGDKSKPAIVLIHGFAQSHMSFMRQLESPELTRDFHLIAFDLRGHGNSGKPWDKAAYAASKPWGDDVIAVMDATGVSRAVLVGWSFGGYILPNVIEHHGTKRIAGLNIVGSIGGMVPPDTSTPPPSNAREVMAANRARSTSQNTMDNFIASKNAVNFLTAQPGDQQWQDLALAGNLMLSAYVRVAMEGRSLDNAKVLPLIDVPVLISRGTRDAVITAKQAEQLRAAIKGARESVYQDIGHSTFYEASDRFNRELAEFAKAAFARH